MSEARIATEGNEGKDTLRKQDFHNKTTQKQATLDSFDQIEDCKRRIPLTFDSKKKPTPQPKDPSERPAPRPRPEAKHTLDKAAQVNTIFAGAEETLPSSDDRNKVWVKPAIKGEIAFMPINKKPSADPDKVLVPSIEVHGLYTTQPAPSNENYFKMSSRDEETGKHHGFSKRQTANFLQFSDRDPHKSRSPGKELGKVNSENEFQGDLGKDSEADPDNQDPNNRFPQPQVSHKQQNADRKQDQQNTGLNNRSKQYNSSPPDSRPLQNQSTGVKSTNSKKKQPDNLLTESEPGEEEDYINRNLSQEDQIRQEDHATPSDIRPNDPSSASKPQMTSSSKPPMSLIDRRREALRKKETDNTDNHTQKSGTDKKSTPPRKQLSPLPSPKSKVDTAGLSQKSSKKPNPTQTNFPSHKDKPTATHQVGKPSNPDKRLNRNKTDSNLLGKSHPESKLVQTDNPQTENKSSQKIDRHKRLDDSSNPGSEDDQQETSSIHSNKAAQASKKPPQHIFTAENINREDFDEFASEDEKDIRNEIPEDFKPKSSRNMQLNGARGRLSNAPRFIQEQPNELTGENSANKSPRYSVERKGFPQSSILMDERKSATNRELQLPKSKLELSNIIKKSSHRFSVGPESLRQSTLPALVEPLPEPVDKRDFFVEKPQAGGFTISKLPRFDTRPALNIDAIKHIKRFPAAAPDQVQSALQ